MRVLPILFFPRTVGLRVFAMVPEATAGVCSEIADAGMYPVREPVTRTEICFFHSPVVRTCVEPFAPPIAVPSASHWKV